MTSTTSKKNSTTSPASARKSITPLGASPQSKSTSASTKKSPPDRSGLTPHNTPRCELNPSTRNRIVLSFPRLQGRHPPLEGQMNTGTTFVNLRQLEERLNSKPLDEIATIVQHL